MSSILICHVGFYTKSLMMHPHVASDPTLCKMLRAHCTNSLNLLLLLRQSDAATMPIPSVDAGACHGFFQNMNIHNGPLQEALLLCVGRTMFINEMLLMRGSFLYAR